ncbi:MAG: hypothetical protein ACK54F_03315 [Planctomycetia bacterium]|jgi:hypothetical protein
MHPSSGNLFVAIAVLAATLGVAPAQAPADDAAAPVYRAELEDGSHHVGALVKVDAEVVTLEADGAQRSLPVAAVRRLERESPAPAPAAPAARLTLVDGSTLAGDEFSWADGRATLVVPQGRVELPIERVRSVAWRKADAGEVEWLSSLPESIESDLVVVRKGDGFEFVDCAIAAVSADAVSVVLDEEKIPVKRTKVIGLHWLRPAAGAEPAAVTVDVVGGSLRADRVEWTPTALVVDGVIRIPSGMLERIDFASGRTIQLATLEPERLEVEPYFGGLAKIAGLAGFFAPRAVPADRDVPQPGLLVRPRTVAVWRLPTGSRRLRTAITPATKAPHAPAIVAISLDEREVFRGSITAESPAIIDLDLVGGRRLTLTVDFGAAAGSGPVRLAAPIIEK